MTIRIGIVMDPISAIHYKKDSSLAMLLAAQQRNWQLSYMEPQDIYLHNGRAMGTSFPGMCWKTPRLAPRRFGMAGLRHGRMPMLPTGPGP